MKSWRSLKHRHLGEPVFIVLFAISTVTYWINMPQPWKSIANDALTVGLISALALKVIHNAGDMCETCITSMPLNVERAVQRNRPGLRFHHWSNIDHPLLYLGSMGVLAVPCIILGRGTTTHILGTLLSLLMMSELLGSAAHRKYYPWCPWCDHGDGDDDETVDAPEPTVPVAA